MRAGCFPSIFRNQLFFGRKECRKVGQCLGHVSRKLLPLQWPSTGTVPTCKMGSNGTKLFHGPFQEFQTSFFIHLNGRLSGLIFR